MNKIILIFLIALNLGQASEPLDYELIKKFNQIDHSEINFIKLSKYNDSVLPEYLIPWEGSYWPHKTGSIAFRKKALARLDWGINFLFGAKNYVKKIQGKIEQNKLNFDFLTEKDFSKMSAVEKYDVLVGDKNFSMTRNVLRGIINNHHYWGRTTNWTGICHGWTPASIHYRRPLHPVVAKASNGLNLTFTIEDLKALSSYLFANSVMSENTIFIGNRCNVDKPGLDPETMLVRKVKKYTRKPSECSDISPAYFYLTLYNRIALKQKSFIVDIDYHSAVNNHPVAGYKTEMMNPLSNRPVLRAQHAIVPIELIENDRFTKLRNKNTAYVAELKTEVFYVDWIRPGQTKEDKDKEKRFLSRIYHYQLELDKKFNIVGGQWLFKDKKSIESPDFIWVYPDTSSPHEFHQRLSDGIEYSIHHRINPQLTKSAIYSANNMLRTNYYTRIRHPRAKELGIHKRAVDYVKKVNEAKGEDEKAMHLRETENLFIDELNKNNVPFWIANPQLISKIIDALMEDSIK